MHSLSEWETAIVLTGLALATVFGWVKLVRPRIHKVAQKFTAASDSILGREAVIDSITGAELAPALPGVGARLAATEQHLGTLAESVGILAQSHRRLDDHDAVIEDHTSRISALEEAAVERIVNRADSAAAWGAMQAASESTPPEDKP